MIHYKFYTKNPASHYLYIDLLVTDCKGEEIELQLPAWRPGRYELGNFAKNIKKFEAFDLSGNPLSFYKKSKDLWVVKSNGASMIKATYSYFSTDLNAGSTYADATQVYVNPVNCCMYVPGRMMEEHVIELDLDKRWKLASSLRTEAPMNMYANDFHELADAPFIASADLQSFSFTVQQLTVHIHIQGECHPDKEKLIRDFSMFTERCLDFFGGVHVNEYHFMFQVVPFRFYHGVEHLKSTVIAIGPGYHFTEGKTYEDVLGVSCHELFHLWNIKTIRPQEMLPYNYTKENYARTGFVYEGFTTYYGDLLLLQSNVFSEEQYFETLEERINKHFHNYGRFNLSVADSSWDNWLDGYVPGAPYRKVSIYDEGNLIAFMLDVLIMKHSEGEKSLQDVCRILYKEFGMCNTGYTEQDIQRIVNEVATANLDWFFTKYVFGTGDYEEPLTMCFAELGLELEKKPAAQLSEKLFGFKTADAHAHKKVSLIAPYSPAWECGLMVNDEIISVNGKYLRNDLNEWLNYFSVKTSDFTFGVNSGGIMKELSMTVSAEKEFFPVRKIRKNASVNLRQTRNFGLWTGK